jgi:hypothetical protein
MHELCPHPPRGSPARSLLPLFLPARNEADHSERSRSKETGRNFLDRVTAIAAAAPQTELKTVSGTISSLDTTGKSLVIKQSSGEEVTVYWNDGTTVSGDLREGQQVRVETKEQDGQIWAMSIQVQAKKPY